MKKKINFQVFQSRKNGNVDFYRNFEAYLKGFGNYLDEFWLGGCCLKFQFNRCFDFMIVYFLGLEKIHELTQLGNFTMRIDLEDFENVKKYQVYK